MTWRVARALDVLLEEIDHAAPNRSRISDGSIGDAAHASRDSDHNPWVIDANGVGVVRARDFTHDPTRGCDAGAIAEAVRQLGLRGHPALGAGAYVIWNSRIASATQDGEPWDWEPYGGSNPHDKHCHVSVAIAAAGYDSTARWGVTEEDDIMATLAELRTVVREELKPIKKRLDASRERERQLRGKLNQALRSLDKVLEEGSDDARAEQVKRVRQDLAEIAAQLPAEEPGTSGSVQE